MLSAVRVNGQFAPSSNDPLLVPITTGRSAATDAIADHTIAAAKPMARATDPRTRGRARRARGDHVAADDGRREHDDGLGTCERADREQPAEPHGFPAVRRHR